MRESYVYISYKKEKEAASSRGEKRKKGEIARERKRDSEIREKERDTEAQFDSMLTILVLGIFSLSRSSYYVIK